MGTFARVPESLRGRAGRLLGVTAAAVLLSVGQSVLLPLSSPATEAHGVPYRITSVRGAMAAPAAKARPTPSAMAAYEAQMLGVIVVVRAAEKNMTAALTMAKSRSRLKEARSDVEAALAKLRYARSQLGRITPPRSLARVHRAVRSAMELLIAGTAEVARGIKTLNAQVSDRGLRTFNQGLSDLRRATRALHGRAGSP